MKTYCYLSMVTLFCFFFSSCQTDKQNAEKAAYQYSFAMANYNVDDAEPYADEETINTTLVKARQLVTAVGEDYIKSDTPAEIEITEIEFSSDTSAIATYHKKTPIKDFSGTVELRKRDGKWLVHTPIPIIAAPEETPQQTTKDGKVIREFDIDQLKIEKDKKSN